MPNQGSDSKMWYANSTTASQSPKTFNFDSNPTSTADSGSVVETLRWVVNALEEEVLGAQWAHDDDDMLLSRSLGIIWNWHGFLVLKINFDFLLLLLLLLFIPFYTHLYPLHPLVNSVHPRHPPPTISLDHCGCPFSTAATSFPECRRWSGSLSNLWTTGSGRPNSSRCCRTSRTTSARWICSSWCAKSWTRTCFRKWTGRGIPSSSRISRWVRDFITINWK